jgi:hypothetical protein
MFIFDNYSLDFEVVVPKRYLLARTTPGKLKGKEKKSIRIPCDVIDELRIFACCFNVNRFFSKSAVGRG